MGRNGVAAPVRGHARRCPRRAQGYVMASPTSNGVRRSTDLNMLRSHGQPRVSSHWGVPTERGVRQATTPPDARLRAGKLATG
jgi:hypothetical protein